MKRILIIITVLFSLASNAQDVFDIIGKETCDCLSKKNFDVSKASSSEIKSTLGDCMLTSYMAHRDELKPEDKTELDNQDGMRKLGESVAMKMLNSCPEVIIQLGRSAKDDEAKVEEAPNALIAGQFLESKSNDFVTISVKDNSGRVHSLILLTFFENSNLISDNILKKNQKIEVEYYEQEFFDPKSKDFRYYKVLQGIKKI